MKNALVAGVVLLGAMALGGCGGKDEPSKITVVGSVYVSGGMGFFDDQSDGDDCTSTTPGLEDLNEGASVVVKNSDGKQVAVRELGPGSVDTGEDVDDDARCVFPFRATVPRDSSYSVTIGGRSPYSFDAADAGDLRLELNG